MSSPHSRRQTNGAFGNQKPRPIGRVFDSPAPVKEEKSPKQKTIADRLAEFSQPLLEQAGGNRLAAKGAMNVAILIWNASIEGPEKVKDAKAKIAALPGSNAEQADELVTNMIERKNELFPGESSLITNFVLNFNRRGTSFSVSSVNVNPEGLKTGNLQEIIQAKM
jgi:hypothetical protein